MVIEVLLNLSEMTEVINLEAGGVVSFGMWMEITGICPIAIRMNYAVYQL